MSHATAQRRSRDGLVEIVPNTVRLAPAVRYALIFGIFLSSGGLYLSALVPPQLFALVVGCCLAAELALVLQEAGVMQPPKAPVYVLGGWRASGRLQGS